MKIAVFCILGCIFMLLFVSSIHGSCKRYVYDELDEESFHNASLNHLRDAQRLFTYSPQEAPEPSTSNTLKFMTFNMQSGFLTSCASNVPAQAGFIQGQKPDYLASEEVVVGVSSRCNCNMPQIIANAFGAKSVFGMTIPYGTGLYGTNTATSQNILETRSQLLAYSGVEQRIVVAVRTQPAALKGRNLWFATCHVDYFNANARYSQIAQAIQFLESIADSKAVIVVGGDFNGGPWDQGYAKFKAAGFKNSWEIHADSIEGGNTIPASSPGSRFDHLWFKLPSEVTAAVTGVTIPDVRLSDHRPFLAELTFTVSGSSTYTPPPPAPPVAGSGQSICAIINEGSPVTLTCPHGMKMKTTQFANYGTSAGNCNAFTKGTCVGGSSKAVVNDKCIGRSTCTFPVTNTVFGDPCPNVEKVFRVQVLCE